MKRRLIWIDNAKAIGIFLVVLAHTKTNPVVFAMINSFAMHLFFFMSGYVFSPGASFKLYLKKRFNTIMLPYFIFGLVSFGFDTLRRFWGDNPFWSDHSIFYPLYRILIFNIYWFLPCLFVVSILFYFIYRKITILNFVPFAFVVLIIHYILSKLDPAIGRNVIVLPFSAIVFFAAGYLTKQNDFKVKHIYSILAVPIYLAIFYWGYSTIGLESFRQFDNYFYQYTAGALGIVIIITICTLIPRTKTMQFLGTNTILIYILSVYPPCVLRRLYGLFGLDFFDSPPLTWAVIYTFSNILLLIPLILAVNRWLPWVIGKPKPNKLRSQAPGQMVTRSVN